MINVILALVAMVQLGSGAEAQATQSGLETAGAEKPTPSLTDRHLDRFIVVPEIKLLFCYIEKVGCTAFNGLFLKLRQTLGGQSNKASLWFSNTPQKHHINKAKLEEMLVDPAW